MPHWLHARADHILSKNPSMSKDTAFAVATLQSHALGKSPKGYGTPEGRAEAKAKYRTPGDDQKVADPKTAAFSDELRKYAGVVGNVMGALQNPSVRDHAAELAGLGVLAVPGVDTLQSRARARMAGDKTSAGAEKRRFLGESGHALADVGGLGILTAPSLGHLMKHGNFAAYSAYGGNQAPNPPGMRAHSPLAPFRAPALAVKQAGVGVGSGMSISQYSGPLSYGPFKLTSGIPAFTAPVMARDDGSDRTKGWMVGGGKTASAAKGSAALNASTTPAGRLQAGQRVGAPQLSSPAGPSIAELSKPKGFGMPLPGATRPGL